VRIELRGKTDHLSIEVGRARPLPLDWNTWRDALVGGAPLAPIVEEYTVPEGWSVTIVDVASGVHAFYAVLDRAVHAYADVAPAERARVRRLFQEAVPVFDDEIAALADL
jgi:hypothetical protein